MKSLKIIFIALAFGISLFSRVGGGGSHTLGHQPNAMPVFSVAKKV